MTLGFTITGDFITEHPRNLWAEGSYSKALDFLECIDGLTHDNRKEIIAGNLKMIGENETLDLVSDSWIPDEGDDYPDFKTGMSRGDNWHELQSRRENEAWNYAYENFYPTRGLKDERAAFFRKIEGLVGNEKAEEIVNTVMTEKSRSSSLFQTSVVPEDAPRKSAIDDVFEMAKQRMVDAGMSPDAIPEANAMLNRGHDLVASKDNSMNARTGWLLPNGDYYPCGIMAHIGMASVIFETKIRPLKDGSDPERCAEERGWVKITSGSFGNNVFCAKVPTKKQLTRLYDYAEIHDKNYVELIKFLPTTE